MDFGSNDFQKVEIFVSCRKLRDLDVFSKSDPYVIVQMKNLQNKQWFTVGQTETILNNLNPNFTKSFLLDYIFEVKQELRFEVRDDDGKGSYDLIGYCETTLGGIVGAKNSTLILDLTDKSKKQFGKIIMRCENVQDCNDLIFMKWQGIKLMNTDGWFDKSDPFLRFNRIREDNTYFQVFETEHIMDNLNPMWKPFEVKAQKLCNGDYHRPIRLECWDWEKSGKHQFIGFCQLSIEELQNGKKEFQITNPKEKKATGTLKCEQFSVQPRPSFLDYIRGGIQLNLITAVDFTGSNGDPRQATSLHYFNPTQQQVYNSYQQAIIALGEILMNYDYDKQVPCYGFGGIPRYPTMNLQQVSHCFPMTGNPNQPEVNNVQGMLDVYNFSIQHVSLSGPTYFNPIIQESLKVANVIKQNGSKIYSILLILTDGEIHDMQATVDSIVSASDQPISVIIVGIGQADFTNMNTLDGDNGQLANSKGQKAKRDVVQFVPFRDLNGNPQLLAKTVLAEIPEQLTNYYRIQSINPSPPPIVNLAQLNMSIAPQAQQSQFQQQQLQQLPPQVNPQQMSHQAMQFGQQLVNQNMQQQQQPPQMYPPLNQGQH